MSRIAGGWEGRDTECCLGGESRRASEPPVLAASKGRLIFCTVVGDKPKRLAITRTPSPVSLRAFRAVRTRSCWGLSGGVTDGQPADSPLPSPLTSITRATLAFGCRTKFFDFTVNVKTLRFLRVYSEGYVGGKDIGTNTPSVSGGACTRLIRRGS
jgi:hypothetical protein